MLGYSISFASFAIVECMTSSKFHIKFIGYLAASQCFDKETEVAVLVVNLVKKVIFAFSCSLLTFKLTRSQSNRIFSLLQHPSSLLQQAQQPSPISLRHFLQSLSSSLHPSLAILLPISSHYYLTLVRQSGNRQYCSYGGYCEAGLELENFRREEKREGKIHG